MNIPHCCPVCNGTKVVPNGFYNQTSMNWVTTDATPEICQSCNGTGIVWDVKINSIAKTDIKETINILIESINELRQIYFNISDTKDTSKDGSQEYTSKEGSV